MRRDEFILFIVNQQLTCDWLKPEFRTGALKGLRAARIHYDAGLAGRSMQGDSILGFFYNSMHDPPVHGKYSR